MSSGEGGQFLFMNKSSSLTSWIGIQGNEYERNPAKHFVNRKFAPSLCVAFLFTVTALLKVKSLELLML